MHPMVVLSVAALALGLAIAGGHAVILPKQACNQGTEHAHGSIPPTLPNGRVTPGHFHVPEMVDGNCTTPHQ
jgi:hypothetical protein